MEISKQNQAAGDNSQQLQVGSVGSLTIVNGITEQRAREIFQEMNRQSMTNYTQDAYTEALRRIAMLENQVMKRAEVVDGAIEAFADPAFQILLAEAQKRAAATEREADYDLLSELLVCHVQKGACRTNRAGISRAVEIVGDIDTNALCALTVAHAVTSYVPITGSIIDGLKALSDMFGKLMYEQLPPGKSWLDHLDVLGAVRLSSFGHMKKIIDFYAEHLGGYVCVGIQKNSEKHKKAADILAEANIDSELLIDNECFGGYVRLNIRNEEAISELTLVSQTGEILLSQEQQDAVHQVWALYSQDSKLKQQAQKKFSELWDGFETLAVLRKWWDSIAGCFHITQVGRVLAHTNAKRCDPDLPDFV